MGANFAFFLPIMMASFGFAFLFAWAWGARGAEWWSCGFFSVAAGFAVPAAYALLPSDRWGIPANIVFASGFLFFSQALLARWRTDWLLSLRIAVWGISILLSITGNLLDHGPLELMASDFGCFLLIAIPLIAGRRHLARWSDRTLFAAVSLVAMDNLFRGVTLQLTRGNGDFFASEYAFLMQALASLFGLFMALSALSALILDLLAQYRHDAHVDPLSGLLNRRGFEDAMASASPDGSVVVCDIDHFKTVNDRLGHAVGDQVIAMLAQMIREEAPPRSVAARFGGEEFVLFLPAMDAARAAAIGNIVRERFATEAAADLGIDHDLTASLGLSTVQISDRSIHDAIARADLALYDAKAQGRNRLCVRRALAAPTSLVARRA